MYENGFSIINVYSFQSSLRKQEEKRHRHSKGTLSECDEKKGLLLHVPLFPVGKRGKLFLIDRNTKWENSCFSFTSYWTPIQSGFFIAKTHMQKLHSNFDEMDGIDESRKGMWT